MHNDKILDRVRKLLALAEGAGTPEEAGTAYAQAQKIIAAHALTEEQIRQARLRETGRPDDREPIVKRIVYVSNGGTMPTWIGVLCNVLSEVNGCDACQGHAFGQAAREVGGKKDHVRTLEVWGRASDLEIVAELLSIISGQIEALCVASGFHGRTALNNFRLGATGVVCSRLRLAAQQARRTLELEAAKETTPAAGEVTALALRTLDDRNKMAEAAMRAAYPKMTAGRSSSSRVDYAAREAGRKAGARVAISRQRSIGGN